MNKETESESESHSVMSASLRPHGLYSPCNSPSYSTGVGSLSLLQGIFPTQGLNTGLLHCRQILYYRSHKGGPRILGWVAYPFSRGSSNPGIEPGSPALQVDSLPTELWGKPLNTLTVNNPFGKSLFLWGHSQYTFSILQCLKHRRNFPLK